MICPVCGCQQRESDQCVQCYTTLTPGQDTEEKSEAFLEDDSIPFNPDEVLSEGSLPPPVEEKSIRRPEPSVPRIKPRKETVKPTVKPKTAPEPQVAKSTVKPKIAPEPQAVKPEQRDTPSKVPPSEVLPSEPAESEPAGEETILRIEPRQQPVREGKSDKILVTTTQRIEGKGITIYFGLISAEIILELAGPPPSRSKQDVKSANVHYRSELKKGMLTVLRDLRGEATLLGANAVIATSFNFQKMDLQALLVSAVGTAVHMEDRT